MAALCPDRTFGRERLAAVIHRRARGTGGRRLSRRRCERRHPVDSLHGLCAAIGDFAQTV